jgi:hypothetical protein
MDKSTRIIIIGYILLFLSYIVIYLFSDKSTSPLLYAITSVLLFFYTCGVIVYKNWNTGKAL